MSICFRKGCAFKIDLFVLENCEIQLNFNPDRVYVSKTCSFTSEQKKSFSIRTITMITIFGIFGMITMSQYRMMIIPMQLA